MYTRKVGLNIVVRLYTINGLVMLMILKYKSSMSYQSLLPKVSTQLDLLESQLGSALQISASFTTL